jgi:transcriptional regulator with XRE-family HTH domain
MQGRIRFPLNAEQSQGVSISRMPKRAAPTPERDEFARKLRVLLDHWRMSQRDLAKHMGVSDTTVHQWVTALVTPRSQRLRKLAALFNEQPDFFLPGDDEALGGRALSHKLLRLAEAIGPDRLDYLDSLAADELCALVDDHELRRSREARRAETPKPPAVPITQP